jgi:hypothetical protein
LGKGNRRRLFKKNLPVLTYEKEDNLFAKATYTEQKSIWYNAGSKGRKTNKTYLNKPFASANDRSRFHKGVARAMAQQWTEYINKL